MVCKFMKKNFINKITKHLTGASEVCVPEVSLKNSICQYTFFQQIHPSLTFKSWFLRSFALNTPSLL